MKLTVNAERLAQTFTELCEISSPSRKEGGVSAYLKKIFEDLGADEIVEDSSSAQTGSECNNLIIRFNGEMEGESLLFSTHMDTVLPCDDVQVVRKNDVFSSEGETILGADDKSGIACCIEMIRLLKENNQSHTPVEFVFTTCEEIGLIGAKHLDCSLIQSRYGYALDSSGINKIIIAAPAANKLEIKVQGFAAHAGLHPENGVNALQIAAKAIARLNLGRIDEETTANVGIIQGGVAQNIIPDLITIEGEVRSHDPEKLRIETENIVSIFQQEIDRWDGPAAAFGLKPTFELNLQTDYPAMSLSPESYVVQQARKASERLGIELEEIVGGGGSDANILNESGIETAIIATGMTDVHTTEENQKLEDLVTVTEFLFTLVTPKKGNSPATNTK